MTLCTLNWTELSLQAVITFAHFLWQACLIAALLMVIDRWLLARQLGQSAKLRYLVACIAFFALPTSVAATYAMVHHARGAIVLASSARNVAATPANARTTETNLSVTVPQDDLAVDQGSVNQAIQTAHPVDASRSSNALESSSDWSQPLQAASPYLLMAYACGVICLLARFGVSIIGSSRLRTMVEPITDTQLARIVTEQSARLQLKRIPVVALCQRVSVPVVVGIIKPMILLPTSLYLGLDPSQLAAVLSHEMAHIRRYDLIVNLLQRIVEALLFFHPVTWWISRRVSMERENCCDDVAAACMGRLPYAGALLHMAEISMRHQRERHTELASLAADGGNASDFGYRIRRLIDVTETTRIGLTRQSFFMGLALITILMVSFVAWGQNPNPQDSQRNTSASPNTAATGTFQGRIMLTDVPPPLPKLRVPSPQSPLLSKVATDEEREAYEASLVDVADESMLVDEKQGLANVFVYLAKRPSAWQPTNDVLEPASLTFSNDRLEPRAAIVSTDQDLRVTNTGEMLDTFRFEPIQNGPQNRLIMNGTEFQVEKPFDKPERTPIVAKSDIHPWKKNYLLVVDHPFAAITDSQGRFSINGLPPGEHTFLVWHERVGWLEKSLVVNVQAGETTTVDRFYGLNQFGMLTFQANTRNAPAGILWGEAVEGLRLGIRPSPLSKRSTPLRQGDHLEFEVWLKNETDKVVKIDRDPRDVYSPRLMEDGSINVVGWSMFLSFGLPPDVLDQARLVLPPGHAAHRFQPSSHSASIQKPEAPRGRFGLEPLQLEPGRYPVYAQIGDLKSGVSEVEILPPARLQIRRASEVTDESRAQASQDPAQQILTWRTGDNLQQSVMVNWSLGVLIDEGDLVSVKVVPTEGQADQYSVLLRMQPESAAWFARETKMLSEMQEPTRLVIMLEDKPLMAPRLITSIADGEIMITGNFALKEAEEIAGKLQLAIRR